ncbi:MAG: stomatin-like protein [Candidatus Sericytochromatia bacterium]|nr:stomatin-like protein [Candidatus Sericytochromatia bacterium]
MESTFTLLLLALLAVALISKSIVIVKQSEAIVVERLGSYHRTLSSGPKIIWPILDSPREVEWRYNVETGRNKQTVVLQRVTRIDLRETVFDFPRQNVITRDNVVVDISALLYFQVTDPVKVIYEIANLPDAIEKLTQTSLRNVIGELDLDETLTSRDTINSKLRSILDQATHKWGIKVTRVELQDITPPLEIKGAMEKQMRAERDRRAAILEAEGQKQARILESEGVKDAQINQAEGDRQARILEADAEAQARLRVAEAEAQAIARIAAAVQAAGGDPTSYLLGIRYIDAFRAMNAGSETKTIYLPYEASAMLGALGGIGQMMGQREPRVGA